MRLINVCTSAFAKQRAQDAQVDDVQVFPVADTLGCLEIHGDGPQTWIVQQQPEAAQSHGSLADVLVTIDAAAESAAAVIQMDRSDLPDTNQPIKFRDGGLVLLFTAQCIAGSEDMARVKADAQPVRLASLVEDCRQLFESPAKARPLSGGGFQQHGTARPAVCPWISLSARTTFATPNSSVAEV